MILQFKLSNKEYNCTVKESQRAKRILLKRSRTGELILVLPKGRRVDKDILHKILEKNEKWIYKTQKEELSAPSALDLKAMGEVWKIIYQPSGHTKVSKKIDKENKVLAIYSASSLEDISKMINSFLSAYAKDFLHKRLEECQKAYQIELKKEEKLKISLSRGRWGSYAKNRNISLNARLILFSIDLVDYVIVHELCHVMHLNHSKDFYALLAEKMPDYKEREKEIKEFNLPQILWL